MGQGLRVVKTISRLRYLAACAIVFAFLALAGPFLWLTAFAGSAPGHPVPDSVRTLAAGDRLTLDGVPEDTLKSAGITLTRPLASSTAKASAADAEAVALANGPGVPLKETALGQLHDDSRVPPVDKLVWVVSLDPTSVKVPAFGPPGSPPYADTIYWLIFIDAQTGQFFYSTSAATTDGVTADRWPAPATTYPTGTPLP